MSEIKRVPVVSGNVAAIGYDPATFVLEVEFNSGGVYAYAGVPTSLYNDLLAAPSVGKCFNERVKGKYRCELIEKLPAAVPAATHCVSC